MLNLNDPNIPIIGAKPKMTDEQAGDAILATLQMLVTLIRDMLPYVEAVANLDTLAMVSVHSNAKHICSAVYEFLGEEK